VSEVCLDKRSPNFGLTEQDLLIRAGETPLQENDRHDRARNRNLGITFSGVPVVPSDALKPGQNPLLVNRPRGAGFMGTVLASVQHETKFESALVAVSPDGVIRMQAPQGFDHGLVNGERYEVVFRKVGQ